MKHYDEDAAPFEPIKSTQFGKGSATAANKGKVKRRLKYARVKQSRIKQRSK